MIGIFKRIYSWMAKHGLKPYFTVRDMSNPTQTLDSKAKNMKPIEQGPSAGEIGFKMHF